ncbi:MAG: hypothetical protein JWQ45_1641 [Blastococcus sp.]|jgi:hypothetical protein|nr:hypothetical protein [Blastococcus sp.]
MGTQRRRWQPRYELWVVRADAPDVPVLLRSRHRIRAFAAWSRRLEREHVRLLRGCQLVIVDRDDRSSIAVAVADVTPIGVRRRAQLYAA